MSSSQIQLSQAPTSSMPIQNIEISIQNLIKSWHRRQKWQHFVNSSKDHHDDHHERATWRTLLINFLESTSLRILTIFLLLVDLILTSLELSSSLLSCTKKSKRSTGEETWFHWIGIAILCMLCVKVLALLVGLGGSFFRRTGYVVDGVVVVVALFLEAYWEKRGGGLVVVVSLWRIVRLVESAFELSDEAIQEEIGEIVCQFETLKDENKRLQEMIVEKDMIIEKLQEELEAYET